MELDPLLSDLKQKKKSFEKGVVSLASELKDIRRRLARSEESFARETSIRQAAESKAERLEEHVSRLQRWLGERDEKLMESTSCLEKYQEDLEVIKSQLQVTQAAAVESSTLAQSANDQCSLLLKELDGKDKSLKEQETLVNKFMEQVSLLQKDLEDRESSQKQLKDEIARIGKEIMFAVMKASAKKNCEIRKAFAEISPKNLENVGNNTCTKGEEISMLRDELRSISTYWKHKTKELELKLEKHQRADQELRKRVLILEFCLQEARAQARKLQRTDEKRERAIKELQDQLAMKQQNSKDKDGCLNKQPFWESDPFKVFASMSMLVLVVFSKR